MKNINTIQVIRKIVKRQQASALDQVEPIYSNLLSTIDRSKMLLNG